jgi:hypothetical protein
MTTTTVFTQTTTSPHTKNRRCWADRNGGLTGEFAALGSLCTAGYLFLLII